VSKAECGGGLKLEVKIGAKLLTQGGRGHAFNQRLTLGSAVVREPLALENLLTDLPSPFSFIPLKLKALVPFERYDVGM
jgi:hypothetical protein